MSKIYNSITELIGNTPLLALNGYKEKRGLKSDIYAKLEMFNPLSSIKDRVAYAMIRDGIKVGAIKNDTTIIEPTSGNTGIGLAFVCAHLGLKLILTMPDSMSKERISLLKALGATLVLTDGKLGMQGSVEKAYELQKELGNAFIPMQFENPSNPKIHSETTAQEILKDTDGKIDYFVATVGTGGTISGIAETLKKEIKNIKVIAVEPYDSPLLSKGISGPHKLQGIGANFIPKTLNRDIYDEIITVKTEEAYTACKELIKTEGVFAGISSGAALHASTLIAKENKDKKIVTIFPDSGERYLSTDLFED